MEIELKKEKGKLNVVISFELQMRPHLNHIYPVLFSQSVSFSLSSCLFPSLFRSLPSFHLFYFYFLVGVLEQGILNFFYGFKPAIFPCFIDICIFHFYQKIYSKHVT